ncbi:MAG: PAS domain S-box protein, partial [Nitrospira sp.]|nr:PAS domain S-box protein [Nitrospira sp.]
MPRKTSQTTSGKTAHAPSRKPLRQRRDWSRQLKRLSELTLLMGGDPADVFDQMVRVIGELFSMKVVCVSEVVGKVLKFRSVYIDGEVFRDAGECPLSVMPCETVVKDKEIRMFDRVLERFPQAALLKDHQGFSYCGFPAVDHGGHAVAVTCLLDDKPRTFTDQDRDILQICGQRIAAEVERERDMAERKGMEDRLRASEARLEFLLSATPAVIYSARPSGDYGPIFVSDNVTEILGYSPDEFIADSGFWGNRIHPDDRERVFAELPNLFEYRTFVHEYRFLHRDGSYRWLRDELQVIYDDDKQPIELVGCMTDITNRKQAETLLVDSEARFRHMVEHLPIGLASVDQDGVMTMVNAEMETIFGYRRGELIGQSIDELVPPRYRATHIPSRQDFLRNPRTARLGVGRDLLGLRKDGEEIQLEIGLTPLQTTRGSQILTSIVDITARKKAEAELLAERDRLRQILDSLFGFVVLLSPDGVIEDINRAPLLLMGVSRDDVIGKRFWEIGWVVPGHESRVQTVVQSAAHGEVVRTEIIARFATIGDRFIDAVFSPLRDPNGHIIGVVAFGIDDTDRKEKEEALRTNEERLRLALRAAKQGLYDLDLRTGQADVNDEYAAMLGYEPSEFKESTARWIERVHPDERKKIHDIFDAYIRGDISTYEVEFRQRAKSGDWKWILCLGSIVDRDADGRPLRMLGTYLDITERKRIEGERQQTLTLLSNIVNAIPDFIFVKDRQLRIMLCNGAFAKAVGKDPRELIGHTDIENGWDPELVYGNSSKGIRGFERDDQDVLDGRVVHNAYDPMNTNGHARMFDTYKVPLVSDGGEVIGVLG